MNNTDTVRFEFMTNEQKQDFEQKRMQEQQKQKDRERIQKLIVCVCEMGIDSYKENIEKLVGQMEQYLEKDNQEHIDLIVKVFSQSIIFLDNKQEVYATVLILMSQSEKEQIKEKLCAPIFKSFYSLLLEQLKTQKLFQSINGLNFLINLTSDGYFSEDHLETIVNNLTSLALKKSDFYSLLVLNLFARNIEKFAVEEKPFWQNSFDKLSEYVKSRDLSLIQPFQLDKKITEQRDGQTVLVERIQKKIIASEFSLNGFTHPIKLFTEQIQKFENKVVFQEDEQDSIQNFISSVPESDIQTVIPYIYQQVFKYAPIEKTKEIEGDDNPDYESEDEKMDEEKKENQEKQELIEAKKIFDFSLERVLHSINIQSIIQSYSSSKLILLKKLSCYVDSEFTFSSELLIKNAVESILNQMLELPTSKLDTLVYSSLLFTWSITRESVKGYVNEYLSTLFLKKEDEENQSSFLFENLEFDLIDRLAMFYASFLSNTHLQTDWEIFSQFAADDEEQVKKFSTQKYFLKQLLKQLSFFVSANKLKESVPEGLNAFFPDSKENLFKLENQQDEEYDYIKGKLNEKTPGEDMLIFMKTEEDFKKIFITFFECLLLKMSPSQTHLNILFDRYQAVFKEAKQSIENFSSLFTEKILSFWKSEFHLLRYLEKFRQNNIISNTEICFCLTEKIEEILGESDENQEEQLILYFRVLLQIIDYIPEKIENQVKNNNNNDQQQQLEEEVQQQQEKEKEKEQDVSLKVDVLNKSVFPEIKKLFEAVAQESEDFIPKQVVSEYISILIKKNFKYVMENQNNADIIISVNKPLFESLKSIQQQ